MNSVLLISASFLLGVDYKVEQSQDQTVYVIEVEESLVDQLADGFEITSIVPPDQTRIDRVRITIVKDPMQNDETIPAEGDRSMPSLSPDISIIPHEPERLVSSELQLEPKAISLPDLAPHDNSPVESDSVKLLIPEFDAKVTTEPQSYNETLELLTPGEPIVSLPDLVEAAPAEVPQSVDGARSLTDTTSETPQISEEKEPRRQVLPEPSRIQSPADTFIALATHQQESAPNEPTSNSSTVKVVPNTTPLLLLLFSATLNLFLGIHVYRQYRA